MNKEFINFNDDLSEYIHRTNKTVKHNIASSGWCIIDNELPLDLSKYGEDNESSITPIVIELLCHILIENSTNFLLFDNNITGNKLIGFSHLAENYESKRRNTFFYAGNGKDDFKYQNLSSDIDVYSEGKKAIIYDIKFPFDSKKYLSGFENDFGIIFLYVSESNMKDVCDIMRTVFTKFHNSYVILEFDSDITEGSMVHSINVARYMTTFKTSLNIGDKDLWIFRKILPLSVMDGNNGSYDDCEPTMTEMVAKFLTRII